MADSIPGMSPESDGDSSTPLEAAPRSSTDSQIPVNPGNVSAPSICQDSLESSSEANDNRGRSSKRRSGSPVTVTDSDEKVFTTPVKPSKKLDDTASPLKFKHELLHSIQETIASINTSFQQKLASYVQNDQADKSLPTEQKSALCSEVKVGDGGQKNILQILESNLKTEPLTGDKDSMGYSTPGDDSLKSDHSYHKQTTEVINSSDSAITGNSLCQDSLDSSFEVNDARLKASKRRPGSPETATDLDVKPSMTPVKATKKLDDTASPLKFKHEVLHSTQIDDTYLNTPRAPVNRNVSYNFRCYEEELLDMQDANEGPFREQKPFLSSTIDDNGDISSRNIPTAGDSQEDLDQYLETYPQHGASSMEFLNSLYCASTLMDQLGDIDEALNRTEPERVSIDVLENIHQSLTNENLEVVEEPEGLQVSLLPHQKAGLSWLLWRETQNPSGGILADDMGLGKTLSMLSLILKTRELSFDDDSKAGIIDSFGYPTGGTLVICPTSVMLQWVYETTSKIKPGQLTTLTYHGVKRETDTRKIAGYDIVFTTYSMIQKQPVGGPLFLINWSRVILDEAHIIRNSKSKTAQAIFKLQMKSAWALTGTPVQNKAMDLYSIFKFIKCQPFDNIKVFTKCVRNLNKSGMRRLNVVMKTVMLRRTKEDLKKIGELESLKEKHSSVITVKLDEVEQNLYEKVATLSRAVFVNYLKQRAAKEDVYDRRIQGNHVDLEILMNISKENPFKDHPGLAQMYTNMLTRPDKVQAHEILVLILRLRQICCHPNLAVSILQKSEIEPNLGIVGEDNTDLSSRMALITLTDEERMKDSEKFPSPDDPVFDKSKISSKFRAVIHCLLDIYASNIEDKLIVVSQWTSALDILTLQLNEFEIPTLSLTGKMSIKDRLHTISKFNNPADLDSRILLLSLTAGGTGLNLMGANHMLLVDVHWNPQLETQASDRIFRVGQTKEVYIYKFICADTIEENIVELQKKKLEVAANVLTGSMKVQSNTLTIEDLKLLFNVR